MTELNNDQLLILASRIDEWLLYDEDLRCNVAMEQARNWTLKEYNELLEDENEEQV